MSRPLILVTNDDGILAPGIAALTEAVAPLGDVIVVAPDTERSGSSHAISLHTHLRAEEMRPGWFRVNGTPVDCVYLGALHLCGRRPDLVVSGVNPGYNLGSDVFYSGTVGGAAEGFIRGPAALAISVHARESPRVTLPIVRTLARLLLTQPLRTRGRPRVRVAGLGGGVSRVLATARPGQSGAASVRAWRCRTGSG